MNNKACADKRPDWTPFEWGGLHWFKKPIGYNKTVRQYFKQYRNSLYIVNIAEENTLYAVLIMPNGYGPVQEVDDIKRIIVELIGGDHGVFHIFWTDELKREDGLECVLVRVPKSGY